VLALKVRGVIITYICKINLRFLGLVPGSKIMHYQKKCQDRIDMII
jgi:hypothetical protein